MGSDIFLINIILSEINLGLFILFFIYITIKKVEFRKKVDDASIISDKLYMDKALTLLVSILLLIPALLILLPFNSNSIEKLNYIPLPDYLYPLHFTVLLIISFFYAINWFIESAKYAYIGLFRNTIMYILLSLNIFIFSYNPQGNLLYLIIYLFVMNFIFVFSLQQQYVMKTNYIGKLFLGRANGMSMLPTISGGEYVIIDRGYEKKYVEVGNIIEFITPLKYSLKRVIHRIVKLDDKTFITKGDNSLSEDPAFNRDRIIGIVIGAYNPFTNELRKFHVAGNEKEIELTNKDLEDAYHKLRHPGLFNELFIIIGFSIILTIIEIFL